MANAPQPMDDGGWEQWRALTAQAYRRYHDQLLAIRGDSPELTDYNASKRVEAGRNLGIRDNRFSRVDIHGCFSGISIDESWATASSFPLIVSSFSRWKDCSCHLPSDSRKGARRFFCRLHEE